MKDEKENLGSGRGRDRVGKWSLWWPMREDWSVGTWVPRTQPEAGKAPQSRAMPCHSSLGSRRSPTAMVKAKETAAGCGIIRVHLRIIDRWMGQVSGGCAIETCQTRLCNSPRIGEEYCTTRNLIMRLFSFLFPLPFFNT